MGAVGLIAMIFGAFAFLPMMNDRIDGTEDDDEDDEPVDPADTIDPVDPIDPETLGATFESADEGITIEFGENETGSLAIFTYADPVSDENGGYYTAHEARYYLVPEGVEWPENTSETADTIPGVGPGNYSPDISDFEDTFDLTLLGTVDLLAQGNDTPTNRNMADALPELTANRDADYYYLLANDDGDELLVFLKEGWQELRNGVEETNVTEDAVGTDGSDWITTSTSGITLDGAGGDDTLVAHAADVSVLGGDGDDSVTAYFGGATVDGGAGDDRISAARADIYGGDGDDDIYAADSTVSGGDGADNIILSGSGDNNVAYGDAGDDDLSSTSTGETTLYGGAGDDNLTAHLAGSRVMSADLYGGDGNDFLGIGNGAVAYGEGGDDRFQAEAGSTAYGGAGDDVFRIWDFLDNDEGTAVVIGGEGADTFEAAARINRASVAGEIYAQIEDFDPDEDILLVGTQNSDGLEAQNITIVDDAGGAFSDVLVDFGQTFDDEARIMTIRIMGDTGITAEHVMLS
ncbi:MAG: calcium-binding protein [Octadecabacter sp.]